MLRKFVCAIAIMGFSLGLALAEDLKGRITKVDGTTIMFAPYKDKKLGEAKEYEAKGATVSKKDGDEKVKVEGGLKSSVFTKIGEKGVMATITVDDGKVTAIVLGGKKKKE